MRTIILGVLIALTPLAFLSADGRGRNNRDGESAGAERSFVLDAGFTWASNPRLIGGHFDMGFVLHKKVLYLQNNILLRAGGLSFNNGDYSIFTVSDKLIIGRNSRDMMYTYLEGGFGIYGNDTKPFFEDPFAVSFGFGGGWDIGMDDFGGLYVELGYLGQMAGSKYPVSGVIIQTGWKLFF